MRRMMLRDTRKALGLSQADLAAKLGVTQGTVSRMETGAQPFDERTKLAVDALRMRAEAGDAQEAA